MQLARSCDKQCSLSLQSLSRNVSQIDYICAHVKTVYFVAAVSSVSNTKARDREKKNAFPGGPLVLVPTCFAPVICL